MMMEKIMVASGKTVFDRVVDVVVDSTSEDHGERAVVTATVEDPAWAA